MNTESEMFDKVFEALKKDNILNGEKRVIAACSGGPDSIFLCECLKRYGNLDIHLFHLNHSLRTYAKRDEEFVHEYAVKNGFKFHPFTLDIKGLSRDNSHGIEEEGRIQRYALLKGLSAEFDIHTVVTGHHLDDDIETFIMNYIRGMGSYGFAGIEERSGIYFRPLLSVRKSEIVDYLKQNGIDFVIDETNSDTDCFRNDIRNRVMPELKKLDGELYDHFEAMLANAKLNRRSSIDTVRAFIDDNVSFDNGAIVPINRVKKYFPHSRGMLYMEIIRMIKGDKKDIYRSHVELIDSIIDSAEEKKVRVADIDVIKSYDSLIFGRACAELNRQLLLTDKPEAEDVVIGCFSCDNAVGDIEITKRRSGDFFKQHNRPKKSLKKLMIDEKVPKHLRDELAVIRDAYGILFVEKIGAGERARVDDNSKKIMYLIGRKNESSRKRAFIQRGTNKSEGEGARCKNYERLCGKGFDGCRHP